MARSPQYTDDATRARYEPECESCGLCCLYFAGIPICPPPSPQPPPQFVQIGRVHYTSRSGRTPELAAEPAVPTDRYMLKVQDPLWPKATRCAALVGTQKEKVSCQVYSDRPEACRDFDAGSELCLEIRKWGGLPPV